MCLITKMIPGQSLSLLLSSMRRLHKQHRQKKRRHQAGGVNVLSMRREEARSSNESSESRVKGYNDRLLITLIPWPPPPPPFSHFGLQWCEALTHQFQLGQIWEVERGGEEGSGISFSSYCCLCVISTCSRQLWSLCLTQQPDAAYHYS